MVADLLLIFKTEKDDKVLGIDIRDTPEDRCTEKEAA